MPNMNTYFQQMGHTAWVRDYDLKEARKLLLLLLSPINMQFVGEVSRYFWSGYGLERK
jgi:hypothetical protein